MKKYIGVGMCLLFIILMAPQVFGEIITFGDNTLYWAGWPSQSSNDSLRNALNTWLDAFGTPNILGGSATINDSGYLTNLTFNVRNTRSPETWNLIRPADLFVDTNNDKTWDYVVNMITNNPQGPGDQGLYAISQPLSALGGYFLSEIPNYQGSIRDHHPIGVTLVGTPLEIVNTSLWPVSLAKDTTIDFSFGFGDQSILLGSNFAIGWTVNCANDVLYQELNHQVPEPATLLLLGFGMIGLAGIGRKRFFAKRIG